MFVLEALVLTFITTPLVTALYPPRYRVRASAADTNFTTVPEDAPPKKSVGLDDEDYPSITRFTVVLDKIEHLPGMMALTQLILPVSSIDADSTKSSVVASNPIAASSSSHVKQKSPDLFVDALRLIELSDRTSAVMKSSVSDTLLHTDPLLGIFRMFGELHDLDIATSLSIVTYDDLAYSVADHARNNSSQLILLPWLPPSSSHETSETSAGSPRAGAHTSNPFDALFGSKMDKSASAIHSHFVRGVFSQSKTDVALFIDHGHTPGDGRKTGSTQHIFLPFLGGPDDRLALDFVVQLCANPKITATVMKIAKKEVESGLAKLEAVHSNEQKAVDEAEINIRDHGHTIHSVRSLEVSLPSVTHDISSRLLGSLIPYMVMRRPKSDCNQKRLTV